MKNFLILVLLMSAPSAAMAEEPDEPGLDRSRPRHEAAGAAQQQRPFGQHTMNASFALGLGVGQGTAFGLGGSFGYFVLDGLEPGLDLEASFGSDQATVISVLPYLRWVPWRSYSFSPYLKVQGGRWFVIDYPDLSVVAGGGGVVLFLSRNAGVQLEVMAVHLVPDEGGCPNDTCTVPSFGLRFGLFFGGP